MASLIEKGNTDLAWQRHAIHKHKHNERCIIYGKVGEGKSRIALRLFATLQLKTKTNICVIVCRRKAYFDWTNEIKICGYSDWKVLEFNSKRPFIRPNASTIWLVSADMLPKVVSRLILFSQIRMVIYDELYLFSNAKAIRTIAAHTLSCNVAKTVGLSGTIMPAQDNLSLWGQTKAVGLSGNLARNITEFRSRFQFSFMMPGLGFRQFRNRPDSKHRILSLLQKNITLHFPKGARQLIQKFNEVPQTDQQKKIIKQLKEEYYVKFEKDGELEIKVATDLCTKIRQISNGYLFDSKGQIHFIDSLKFDALEQSVTETLAADERMLIWCAFRYDVQMLCDRFKFATLQMVGGKKFDHETWQNDSIRVCVATEGSGASVNHFAQVQYAKYFSMSFRWLELQQSMGRTDRTTSKHSNCHYEFFFTKDTLDLHVFNTATLSGSTESDFIKTNILIKWLQQK